jgi:hypothetical protein
MCPRRESNPGPLCLQPGSLSTRPQRRSTAISNDSLEWPHISHDLCNILPEAPLKARLETWSYQTFSIPLWLSLGCCHWLRYMLTDSRKTRGRATENNSERNGLTCSLEEPTGERKNLRDDNSVTVQD